MPARYGHNESMGCNLKNGKLYHLSTESLDNAAKAPLGLDPPYMATHLQDPDNLFRAPKHGDPSAVEEQCRGTGIVSFYGHLRSEEASLRRYHKTA